MLKATVCPTPAGYFTDNFEERLFFLLIPPAIMPQAPSRPIRPRKKRLLE
jgi:hypothetical protein